MNKISKDAARILDSQILEKQLNKEERSITAYVSAKSIDRQNDIVLPEGIDVKNYRKNPVVLFNHDWFSPAIGRSLWQKADDKGFLAKTQFASTPFADDIYTLFVEEILKAWSIGFYPKEWSFDEESEITTFTNIELLEYSAVNIPANPDALNDAKRLVKSEQAMKAINKNNIELMIKSQLKEFEDTIKNMQETILELQNAREFSVINDIEKLENKVSKIQKQIEDILITNIKKNFTTGETLGIDVKSLARDVTRAKHN